MIRPEIPADIDAIRDLTWDAFAEMAFSDQSEAGIIDTLRAADAMALSLVATDGDVVVGHVSFSAVKISDGQTGWYGLGPVAVVPDHQRRGFGQALIREGLRQIKADGASGCVVVGSPDYYSRFGFTSDPELGYGGIDTQYVQRIVFDAPLPKGAVTYHDAFGEE